MITKLGKQLVRQDDNEGLKNIGNTAETIAGSALLNNALASGDLTDRMTLYHGTDKDSAKSIRQQGLLPTTDESAVNTSTLKKVDPERYQKSLGKSYMTKNKVEGKIYSIGTDYKKGGGGEGGVVKINAPIWKMKRVMNPEVDMPFEVWKKKVVDPGNEPPDFLLKMLYNMMRKNVVVEGGVGPEYIKGGQGYKGLNLSEFLEYMRSKPATFAKGLGKAALGLGGIGHGV